jgi:hypothetical protein
MALTPMHLRLESPDGRGDEYRIYDGHVEVRPLGAAVADADMDEYSWRQVTPEQLTSHVSNRTILAEWLKQRLGWRRLLRACLNEQELHMFGVDSSAADRRTA